jgi:alpha-amylase/alpha-mannosidase (GH57 family)
MSIHLVIHGHFYQPPRENPWTGTIQRQPSAAPFHDWNARILNECYEPNARSRVLDERGRIQDIVDNYERISFNFGPTLLSWLAQAAPHVLQSLRAADQASRARLGHGNAVAQSYNHMILPLATLRDRRTQIHWGVREFEHRFGRAPEAMWLAETAVDRATLELLVRAGMRYLILSPAQAARWRLAPDGAWVTSAQAELETRRPYRWVLRNEQGRPEGGLDICFYHAPLSRGVSFQHYLKDAGVLAARIEEAAAGMADPLILLATDGESFGHHERFGDMCLARLFAQEAGRRGIQVTNLATYLDVHRPAWEVELLPESAWSCSHGVGRWKEHCGCSAGGGPGWSQAWRTPLRAALDRLRDALARVFAEEGGALLRDPWAARDDYVDLLLQPGAPAADAFFARHAAGDLGREQRARALRLLEMQHQAMLMYTSCGWFFSDVGGIETIQNLRYAARAIELGQPFAPVDLEAVLLQELGATRSNTGERPTGKQLWAREVLTSRVTVAHAAARALLELLAGRELGRRSFYRWSLDAASAGRDGDTVLAALDASSETTGESLRLAAACRRDGLDFLAAVAPWPGANWAAFAAGARAALESAAPGVEAWTSRHQVTLIRLQDFVSDERHAILRELMADSELRLDASVERLGKESLPVAEAMVRAAMPLPPWMLTLLQASLSRRFTEALAALPDDASPAGYVELLNLGDLARHLGLHLDPGAAAAQYGARLLAQVDALRAGGDAASWEALAELMQIGTRLRLSLPERGLQDRVFPVLQTVVPGLLAGLTEAGGRAYRHVVAILTVAERLNLRTVELRARLRPLEEPFTSDPAFWP